MGRNLPDTLKVEIRERVPLALAEVERLYLMDKDGGLIDLYGPRTASFDLPIVRGLTGVDEEARRDRAQRAGTLLDDLGELAGEVSEVLVLPSGDLRVVLRGAGEVLHPRRAALPCARPDLPLPAQGPHRAMPGRRVLRPALSRADLREAAAAPAAGPRRSRPRPREPSPRRPEPRPVPRRRHRSLPNPRRPPRPRPFRRHRPGRHRFHDRGRSPRRDDQGR